MKIAPRLQYAHIKAPWCGQCGDDADAPACGPTHAVLAQTEKLAKAELRALLAVAKLAERAARTNADPGNGWTDDDWVALDRALARLERVSKETP